MTTHREVLLGAQVDRLGNADMHARVVRQVQEWRALGSGDFFHVVIALASCVILGDLRTEATATIAQSTE
jgi:hypothetical protein